jgi:hypothetical protein
MLLAHFGKEVSGWTGTPSSYVFMTLADTFNGFLEILALPFQIGSKGLIKCGGGVLATPLRVFLQLRLALGFEGNYIHSYFRHALIQPSVRGKRACVKRGFPSPAAPSCARRPSGSR